MNRLRYCQLLRLATKEAGARPDSAAGNCTRGRKPDYDRPPPLNRGVYETKSRLASRALLHSLPAVRSVSDMSHETFLSKLRSVGQQADGLGVFIFWDERFRGCDFSDEKTLRGGSTVHIAVHERPLLIAREEGSRTNRCPCLSCPCPCLCPCPCPCPFLPCSRRLPSPCPSSRHPAQLLLRVR